MSPSTVIAAEYSTTYVDRGAWTHRLLNKVPEVTLLFWAVKILSTTVGETAADFLNSNLGLGLSSAPA